MTKTPFWGQNVNIENFMVKNVNHKNLLKISPDLVRTLYKDICYKKMWTKGYWELIGDK